MGCGKGRRVITVREKTGEVERDNGEREELMINSLKGDRVRLRIPMGCVRTIE
jgi:hypothetical protein